MVQIGIRRWSGGSWICNGARCHRNPPLHLHYPRDLSLGNSPTILDLPDDFRNWLTSCSAWFVYYYIWNVPSLLVTHESHDVQQVCSMLSHAFHIYSHVGKDYRVMSLGYLIIMGISVRVHSGLLSALDLWYMSGVFLFVWFFCFLDWPFDLVCLDLSKFCRYTNHWHESYWYGEFTGSVCERLVSPTVFLLYASASGQRFRKWWVYFPTMSRFIPILVPKKLR